VNDNWVMVVCTHEEGTGEKRVAFVRFNRDFSDILYSQNEIDITPEGGTAETWDARDGGVSLLTVPHFPGTDPESIGLGMVEQPSGNNLFWVWTDEITKNPPTFYRSTHPAWPYRSSLDYPLMPELISIGKDLVAVTDTGRKGGMFELAVGYVTRYSESFEINDTSRLCGYSGLNLGLSWGPYQYPASPIHPHVTTLPNGRKFNLFHGILKTGEYEHEIWFTQLDPQLLPLKRRESVQWHPWWDEDISGGDTSFPFTGTGRKTIYFTSDTSGDLTVQANPKGAESPHWFPIVTESGTTEAEIQTSYSAQQMRLKFSAAAHVTATVVQEPRK